MMRRPDEERHQREERVGDSWPLYVVTAVLYVTIGVLVPPFLFSWVVGAGFLVLCIVALPIVFVRLER